MISRLQDLYDLFAKHCSCRALDVTREPDDHGVRETWDLPARKTEAS